MATKRYVEPGGFVRHAYYCMQTKRVIVPSGGAIHRVVRVVGERGSEKIYTATGTTFSPACCIPCTFEGTYRNPNL